MAENKKVKANDNENYVTFTIISVILPVVAILLGVLYLAKDAQVDKKLGEHTLALGVLFMIVWGVVYFMFLAPTTTTYYTY